MKKRLKGGKRSHPKSAARGGGAKKNFSIWLKSVEGGNQEGRTLFAPRKSLPMIDRVIWEGGMGKSTGKRTIICNKYRGQRQNKS